MSDREIPTDELNRQYAQPHIEFTNPEIVNRWLSEYGQLLPEPPTPASPYSKPDAPLTVMLARFYYKPESDVPPFIKTKAHISIADSEGKPIRARYDAVWDREYESEYIYLETAQTHSLIVALLPVEDKVNGIITWGFARNQSRHFVADRVNLKGNEFRLRIELIGKHESAIVLQIPLDFNLKVHPHSLELT
jgi:hypothetical protein